MFNAQGHVSEGAALVCLQYLESEEGVGMRVRSTSELVRLVFEVVCYAGTEIGIERKDDDQAASVLQSMNFSLKRQLSKAGSNINKYRQIGKPQIESIGYEKYPTNTSFPTLADAQGGPVNTSFLTSGREIAVAQAQAQAQGVASAPTIQGAGQGRPYTKEEIQKIVEEAQALMAEEERRKERERN